MVGRVAKKRPRLLDALQSFQEFLSRIVLAGKLVRDGKMEDGEQRSSCLDAERIEDADGGVNSSFRNRLQAAGEVGPIPQLICPDAPNVRRQGECINSVVGGRMHSSFPPGGSYAKDLEIRHAEDRVEAVHPRESHLRIELRDAREPHRRKNVVDPVVPDRAFKLIKRHERIDFVEFSFGQPERQFLPLCKDAGIPRPVIHQPLPCLPGRLCQQVREMRIVDNGVIECPGGGPVPRIVPVERKTP